MLKFHYKAKSKEGKQVSGTVEARDMGQAVQVLRERELVVVNLKPEKVHTDIPILSNLLQRVSQSDVVNFTRQMSTMINAGLPLTGALSLLESQSSAGMKPIITEVLHDVEGGKSYSDSIQRHPRAFNTVYVSLVRAGEASGKLDQMLDRLADNLEKQREFRAKTKGALVYPAIVVVGMVLVSAIMMIFVVPELTSLFEDFGTELPFATKVLIAVSDFAINTWFLIIPGLFAAFWLLQLWKKTPMGRHAWDAMIFKIPIFGYLQKQVMLAEFCRTLGLLATSGVSIVESLNIVSDLLSNVLYSESVRDAAKRVEKGIPLASTIASYDHFPVILSQMISVGEETGKIDEVLLKLAGYFESESEQAIRGLTTAIEPLIMIVLGVGVGFLVLSIIMPIYNLTSSL